MLNTDEQAAYDAVVASLTQSTGNLPRQSYRNILDALEDEILNRIEAVDEELKQDREGRTSADLGGNQAI